MIEQKSSAVRHAPAPGPALDAARIVHTEPRVEVARIGFSREVHVLESDIGAADRDGKSARFAVYGRAGIAKDRNILAGYAKGSVFLMRAQHDRVIDDGRHL